MGIDRRKFIKLSGLTVLGIAGGASIESLAADRSQPSQATTTGKRYAMAVDLKKCHEQEGCTDCIKACHSVHNVPDFGNRKDEIKWIWKESFHNAFHESEHEFLDEEMKYGPALVLCNHCNNPPCVRV